MKPLKKSTALLALGALLATATLAIAADGKSAKDVRMEGARAEAAGPEGPGFAGRMMGGLDLSEEQQAQMKALFEKGREANEVLRQQAQADMAQLRLLVAKKASDSELKKAMDKARKSREEMRESMEDRRVQMAGILTVRQQAMMMARMGEGPMGGCGGTRPGGHGKAGMGKGPDAPGEPDEAE